MKRRALCQFICLSLLFLIFLPLCAMGAGKKKMELVGKETLSFTLPSTQDRIINYADEYYGKYHLVMTFFPAAFTPV